MLDSPVVGIAGLNLDGTVLSANDTFRTLLGVERPIGANLYQWFGPDGPKVREYCEAVVAAAGPTDQTINVVITVGSGATKSVELHAAVTRGSEPPTKGLTVTVVDRTARAWAEAESRRLRGIFDDIGELIGIMSADGTVLSMNPSAQEFFGADPLERGLAQFVPEAWAGFLVDEVLPALRDNQRWEGEVDLLRHDGVEVTHHVTLQRHRADHGGDYYWAIARDRSMVLKAAEADALQRLNAAKDQFIASVSHELRTPLTSVIGFSDVLADPVLSEADRDEYIGLIRHEARAMASIVEDLLVAARVENGRLHIEVEALSMWEMVDEVCAAVLPRTAEQLENRVERDVVAAGDRMRCRQVLRNLIVNAMRHGGDRTWVESESHDEVVLVHVCDNGEGVDAGLRDIMFDAYVSRPNDGMRPESVGLGLTVSRQLARLMGGDLSYDFEDHSRFTLTLPVGSLV